MPRKSIILLVFLLAACGSSVSGDNATLRSDAEWMCQAVVKSDPDAIVDQTYPGLLEKVGGRDAMRQIVVESERDLAAKGLKVVSVEIVSISDPVQAGSELHAVVRTKRTIRSPTGKQIQATYVIAVSSDEGENWTFVDGQNLTPAHILALFPDFNVDLVLPGKSEPVFERNPS